MSLVNIASRRFVPRSELDAYCGRRLDGVRLAGLFVAGSIEALAAPAVAVVGTRAPSDAGRRLAHRLATDLGAAGVCVVSGLALGIDGAAHAGSLAARAPTIGVLGGGHDHFFPARNRELAARMIAGGGGVVSPYEPGVPARPHQFLARNGVVAALADAVVVVEAAARSGALNTASWAADRSIPVMAFPGDVDRTKVAGCLALIRDGAILVRDAADVLAELGLDAPAAGAGRQLPRPTGAPRPNRSHEPLGGANPRSPNDAAAVRNSALCARAGRGGLAERIVGRLADGPLPVDAFFADAGSPAALLACVGELVATGAVIESSDALLRLTR
jgi:DNA protecting protein DprA